MSAADSHEVHFSWPHPEPTTVIVTGTFDQWSSSVHLTKTPTGFEGTTRIPWNEKIKFKFVVDGQWVIHEDQPTEMDPGGFVNNVYTAPPKPTPTISIPTAKPAEGGETPKSLPSPVAPIVPIVIVPVNAAENNTAAPSEEVLAPAPVPEIAPLDDAVPEAKVAPAEDVAAKVEEPSTHATIAGDADVPAVGELAAHDKPVVEIPALKPIGEKVEPAIEDIAPEVKAEETPADVATEGPHRPAVTPAEGSEVVPEPPALLTPAAEEAAAELAEDKLVVAEIPAIEKSAPAQSKEIFEPVAEPTPAAVEAEKAAEEPATTLAPAVAPTIAEVPTSEPVTSAAKAEEVIEPTPTTAPDAKAEPVAEANPATNGRVTPPPVAAPSAPVTPAKTAEAFPSTSDSHSTDNSPPSSKFGSGRKKRTSIFGKFKNIFHSDKEKE